MKVVIVADVPDDATGKQVTSVTNTLRTVVGQSDQNEPIDQFRADNHALIPFQPPPGTDLIFGMKGNI